MNYQQLCARILNRVGGVTEFDKEKKELGLPVIKEFTPVDENDMFEIMSMLDVAATYMEASKNGEEIPEDLTDEIFKARKRFVEMYETDTIPTLDIPQLEELNRTGTHEEKMMSEAILANIRGKEAEDEG